LDAKLVFVGEGPGREEDALGRPFVGSAGELLTKIIRAMKLKRESVYITNVVKCRPPMNRPPEPDEVAACSRYLESQLTTIHPRVICALGKTAASALLETEAPMARLRGKTFHWNQTPVVVTFHPAYLLRNPSAKALVWADMQRVLELLKQ
jgi:DNA polymerase